MIKTAVKKSIPLFTAVLFCFVTVLMLSSSAFAADGVTMRLDKLKRDFPHGWYYNHKVKSNADTRINLLESRDESYALSVSRYPCMDHASVAEKGAYDCNFFDSGYQCHGFASMLFYEIFGVRQSSLEINKTAPFELKAGDLVRLNKDTHSAIVLSVKGDTFTVAECNVAVKGEPASCKIRWGKSYSLSDVSYYIRANNYAEISSDTAWKNIEDKQDCSDSFYAAIYNSDGKALSLSKKNAAAFEKYTGKAAQVWKFTKQKNGSYKVISCENGLALQSEDGSGVTAAAYEGKDFQHWAFYSNGKGYFISSDCGTAVLTVQKDGKASTAEKSKKTAQYFTLKKKKPPVASVMKAKAANGFVSLSWSKGKYTKSFSVELYDEESKLVGEYKGITACELKLKLSAGNYSAKIISCNAYSSTAGNTVYFTVGKKGTLGKTAKVTASGTKTTVKLSWTPVPDADGYAVLARQGKTWKTLGKTAKTECTVKGLKRGSKYTLAIRAYSLKSGKVNFSDVYTVFEAATKLKATAKLTAEAGADSVKLSWSAVKNADGYRVYRKTSTGWKSIGTTAKTGKTVKGLTAGKEYTYGVRAYISIPGGAVWGDIRSITTAAKPKAPELRVSEVKRLKAKIHWNRVSGADGYQVFYKSGDEKEYTHLADYKDNDGGVRLSGLAEGKTYVFAVRAYQRVDKVKIYGEYTTVSFTAIR